MASYSARPAMAPTSWKLPRSTSASTRSRTVSRPPSCWRLTLSGPPISRARASRRRNSSSSAVQFISAEFPSPGAVSARGGRATRRGQGATTSPRRNHNVSAPPLVRRSRTISPSMATGTHSLTRKVVRQPPEARASASRRGAPWAAAVQHVEAARSAHPTTPSWATCQTACRRGHCTPVAPSPWRRRRPPSTRRVPLPAGWVAAGALRMEPRRRRPAAAAAGGRFGWRFCHAGGEEAHSTSTRRRLRHCDHVAPGSAMQLCSGQLHRVCRQSPLSALQLDNLWLTIAPRPAVWRRLWG